MVCLNIIDIHKSPMKSFIEEVKSPVEVLSHHKDSITNPDGLYFLPKNNQIASY